MQLPSTFFMDLNIIFAIGSIILLITAELTSPYYGLTTLVSKNRKLKDAAVVTSLLFIITVIARGIFTP
jgi:hypothetical protein